MISDQKRFQLKRECHHLKPVVIIGSQGYTDNVAAEIDCALKAHELIKIKICSTNKDARNAIAQAVCDAHGADLIQQIGQMTSIYRLNPDNQ